MAGLTHYYHRAKSGIAGIHPAHMAQFVEDMTVATATGVGLGFLSAAIGGLDHELFGMSVPVDGLVAIGAGFIGMSENIPQLRTAAIAAQGSASSRVAERFWKRAVGVHGELEDAFTGPSPQFTAGFGANDYYPAMGYGGGFGAEDPLAMAAQNL